MHKNIDTKIVLKNNADIILTNAGKSNKTILMNKNDYNTKIYNLLNNPSTYSKLKKDPTNESNNTLTIILNELEDKNIINEKLYKFFHCSTNIAPKFYGLPKIHKIDCPLRPITSFIGSPLYNLSKLLSRSMQKTVGHTEYHIKDSFEFKNKISNTHIPNTNTFLEQTHFGGILQFCLESSYCTFSNEFYSKLLVYQWDHLYHPLLQTLLCKSWEFFFFNYLMISYFTTDM